MSWADVKPLPLVIHLAPEWPDHMDQLLTPEEARAFLSNCYTREVERPDWAVGKVTQVRYNGAWLDLCRVDVANQVPTFRSACCRNCENPDSPDDLTRYRGLVRYGARIRDGAFMVMNCMTDG